MGLAYLAENTEAPVAQVILVSLLSFGQGPIAKETPEDLRRATLQIESHDDALTNYHLAFCDEYVTKPEKYLSYVRWNSQKALQALKASPIKAQIVLGGEDRRLGEDWGTQLRHAGMEVIAIAGANHFFDHEHEFELMDTIGQLLQRPPYSYR